MTGDGRRPTVWVGRVAPGRSSPLRAGRAGPLRRQQAETVDDVRSFYESKVPMGRGCLPSDVARAIVYIVEQAYETGQAVPVTGGQNMLN